MSIAQTAAERDNGVLKAYAQYKSGDLAARVAEVQLASIPIAAQITDAILRNPKAALRLQAQLDRLKDYVDSGNVRAAQSMGEGLPSIISAAVAGATAQNTAEEARQRQLMADVRQYDRNNERYRQEFLAAGYKDPNAEERARLEEELRHEKDGTLAWKKTKSQLLDLDIAYDSRTAATAHNNGDTRIEKDATAAKLEAERMRAEIGINEGTISAYHPITGVAHADDGLLSSRSANVVATTKPVKATDDLLAPAGTTTIIDPKTAALQKAHAAFVAAQTAAKPDDKHPDDKKQGKDVPDGHPVAPLSTPQQQAANVKPGPTVKSGGAALGG